MKLAKEVDHRLLPNYENRLLNNFIFYYVPGPSLSGFADFNLSPTPNEEEFAFLLWLYDPEPCEKALLCESISHNRYMSQVPALLSCKDAACP